MRKTPDDMAASLFPRYAGDRAAIALKDTPVVLINGPRQCGKTTLARQLAEAKYTYITLDDRNALQSAQEDPVGFIRELDYAVIDEIQHAPQLLRAIKQTVDENREPGRFLLTGSANVMTLPKLSESLAGRMAVINLLPLAQAEVHKVRSRFLPNAFQGEINKPSRLKLGTALLETVLAGGYPEMLQRHTIERKQAWARDYVNAIIQRDVLDVASIEKIDQLPRLLRLLALQSAQLTNFSQVGGQLNLNAKSVQKYLAVFEQLFLLRRIEPWFNNRLKRLVKTPKLHFIDSGLLGALLGATSESLRQDRTEFGPILETFVVSEILKHTTWYDQTYTLHYYRDKDKNEVDLVLEDQRGGLVGIEVKAAASVNGSDFKGLNKMAEIAGQAFKLGIVLYDGDAILPFGEKLLAAPLSCLWE